MSTEVMSTEVMTMTVNGVEYVRKDSVSPVEFKGDIKIDWSAAKILSVTKDLIDVMLPDAVLPGNNILKSNTIRVKNKEGFTSQGDIVINGWATFVKVLKANESRVIIAVGYTKIR